MLLGSLNPTESILRSAYLSLHWDQNCSFFLFSKSENCASPDGLWIIAYCFQSTELKTPLPTVLFGIEMPTKYLNVQSAGNADQM